MSESCTKEYFSGLNYSLANEDTAFEGALVTQLRPSKTLAVCGSGSRALPLLGEWTRQLTVVDIARPQLWLLELRMAAFRTLTQEEFLQFFGHPPYVGRDLTAVRADLFGRLPLREQVRDFFAPQFDLGGCGAVELLYQGRWERTFGLLARVVALVMGARRFEIFQFDDLELQRAYWRKRFPQWRWKFLMRLLGQKTVFNALLYKGAFIHKNVPGSHYDYYARGFESLFTSMVAKKSFFAQICLLGKILYEEGLLYEARHAVFNRIQTSLRESNVKVEMICGDLIRTICAQQGWEFLSMSDVPCYFRGELEKNFLQQIRPHLAMGGVVVLRHYLRVPEADRTGYQDVTCQFQDLIAKEEVQMYRIEVLRRQG